jgi:hypothetical protein
VGSEVTEVTEKEEEEDCASVWQLSVERRMGRLEGEVKVLIALNAIAILLALLIGRV